MTPSELNQLFSDFDQVKALVIGDVMIDAYYWGKVDRISPEAPVPIVSVSDREQRLGGAANVALNLSALGATPIICTVVGDDDSASHFEQLLTERGMSNAGVVRSSERPTTVKTRIISGNQQMLRVDEETTADLSSQEASALVDRVRQIVTEQRPEVIIFEDYNKGVLTAEVIQALIALAKEHAIPTTVDPKKKNFFEYKGVDLFKPNLKELVEGLKIDYDLGSNEALQQASAELRTQLGHVASLITLSERGVYIDNAASQHHIPAHIRNISDVSGAGDTVISVASLCLAKGVDNATLAGLANLAGGLVCEKVGVVPVDKSQLLAEAQKLTQAE